MKRIYVILGIDIGIFPNLTVCCQTCALCFEKQKSVTFPEVMLGPSHLARSNPWALCFAAALLLLLSLVWAAPGHAGGNTPIFILHSYSQEYPWTKRQHEGFMRALGAAVPDTIAASVEYLDTKRVPYTAAYADFVAAHLARKYAGFQPKLIYVTDDNALLFALTHLARIFPKAPIFFSGINDYGMKQRIDPRQATGVFEEQEIGPNLDLVRHLAPGVRDILVVGDESETFQAIRREVVAELTHQPDIQAQFLSSGRIERLVASLQGRTERFVFLTTLGAMTDAAGNTLTLPETIAAIVQAGRFIIISMEDVYLYPGVLGGYVTSGHKQGAAAAELAARYLAGTALAAIKPVESSPNEYIIDGGELEKLGLALPTGLAGRTTILNPLPTFYERHLRFIVRSLYAFALLFLASFAVFIYALLRKNRQIARTSTDLAAQTEQLRTVIEGFPVVLWAVDREGVFTLSRGAGLKALGLAADEVVGNSLFVIYRDIPTIIENTRRALAGESHVSTNWVGVLAFETHYAPLRDAKGAVIGATGVSTDVTERKRADEALRLSDQRLQEAVRASGIGIYDHDHDADTIYWSPRQRENYGWGPDEPVTLQRFVDQVFPEDRERIADAVRRAHDPAGDGRFDVEHRIVHRNGEVRWLTTRSQTFFEGERKERRPVRTIGAVLDITERKRAEVAVNMAAQRLQIALEGSQISVWETDLRTNQIWLDAAWAAFLGMPPAETRSNAAELLKLVHPDDRQRITAAAVRAMKEEVASYAVEHRVRAANGEWKWILSRGRAIERDAGGRPLRMSGTNTDITERKQADEKLHLAASVFTHAREGIMIAAPDGTIIDVNDTFSRITGYSRDEVVGRNERMLSSGRQGETFYADLWRVLIEKGDWNGEVWNRRKNGEEYAEMRTISAVRDDQGNTKQYVALFSDITASKEHEKQLEHIAHYDALTGLPNRVLLADRLHQAMAQAHRRAQPLAVAYLDLDGFKAINDRHGHDTGDQLLTTVAAGMKQALREGDTLSRLGGDEFVAVLLDLPDVEASVPMLARLLAAAAQPVHVGDLELGVSASLGVTFYPQAEDVDADQLLRQADQAMYQAKLAGKNRYHVFDAEQDRSVRGHHESLERIRHALIEREFVLHYQPKVNMHTGTVIGAEALIRWEHPEKGLLPPAVFLPVIEDHPLAVEIGEWVIDTALTQMTLWQAAGLDIPVSVNVGARQLQQVGFPERLREILAAHPSARPGDLELEVLETSALEDVVGVSKILEACREIGVMFALDDFGTGYSSLTYLKRLPVTLLKIDQSFVRDMLEDPDDLAILEGVIGLAAAFRRQIIAEGVETVEHGEMLLQLGCELAQGYGIARPMPARELTGWSATWRPDPAWINCRQVSRDDMRLLFASVEHRAWIAAIEAFLRGEREIPPQLDHHQCNFGRWLDTERLGHRGAQPVFQSIEQLHLQVHALAAEFCELQARGRNPEALARLGELHRLRDPLLEQMKALVQDRRR